MAQITQTLAVQCLHFRLPLACLITYVGDPCKMRKCILRTGTFVIKNRRYVLKTLPFVKVNAPTAKLSRESFLLLLYF